MRRRGLVVTLVAALTALVASVAFAATRVGQHPAVVRYGPVSMMGGAGTPGGDRPGTVMGMGGLWLAGDGRAVTSIAAARARADQAGRALSLHAGEVVWFDNGFYAELKDASGAPATEVLVDVTSGAVRTEPGPAMMWNTRYGMHAVTGATATVSAARATSIATAWLRQHQAGTTVRSTDAYPGYFTLDLQRGGRVSGMMSVNAVTGSVWYHTWHGRFIAMEDA